MSWGYGYSPMMKDKCYANVVVAWGPLIQQYVLNDLLEKDQKFIDDGYFVLMPGEVKPTPTSTEDTDRRSSLMKQINPYEQTSRFETMRQSISQKNQNKTPFEMKELAIERIWHLSDSLIMILTKELEFRLFYSQKLDYGLYNARAFILDSYKKRLKEKDSPEVKKQGCQIDEDIIVSSMVTGEHGLPYSQQIGVFNGFVVVNSVKTIVRFQQLSWDESLQ
jgi:hypothetical protein